MRKIITILVLITGLFTAQAQQLGGVSLDQIKLEAGWGYNLPTAPTEEIEMSDYAGTTSFYVGANYELNALWGVRATYAYNRFEHKDNSKLGTIHHKIMVEGTFNVLRAIVDKGEEPFELYVHSGLGLSMINSKLLTKDTDMMATFQIGLLPTYHLTEQIGVLLDLAYVVNFSQDYGVHGGPAKSNGKSTTGGYLIANVGIVVKL